MDALTVFTVFENHRKSIIQHCERNELHLYLRGHQLIKNAKNGPFGQVFEKHDACGQTVLPDKSILIGQKLVENEYQGSIWTSFQKH